MQCSSYCWMFCVSAPVWGVTGVQNRRHGYFGQADMMITIIVMMMMMIAIIVMIKMISIIIMSMMITIIVVIIIRQWSWSSKKNVTIYIERAMPFGRKWRQQCSNGVQCSNAPKLHNSMQLFSHDRVRPSLVLDLSPIKNLKLFKMKCMVL